jgi:O-antigen biosynthesis protein WbqV
VNPSLEAIDWQGFLARPAISSPSPEMLQDALSQPILITGAGGSIGSALAMRLAQFAAPRLILLEAAENSLFHLERALARAPHSDAAGQATFVLGNAGDRATLDDLFTAHRPRLVFHAAAHKHVPLLEQQAFAAIGNNIFATETLVAVAAAHSARVVLVSTDKAVEPASVMGATKRVAERIVLRGGGTALRLGNVLASSGSVAEVFAQQIAQGGPMTVTDAEARRYFLTKDEAVNLLLFAAACAAPAILAPALAHAHGIAELAGYMARALAPGREIAVQFTGLRPGDKVAELLWDPSEIARPDTGTPLVRIESSPSSPMQFDAEISALRAAVNNRDLAAALAQLRGLVPGFHPSKTVLAVARNCVQTVSA